jgi:hypothetical protein
LGSVQGMEMVGGLVGRNRIDARVHTSFSANPVSGTSSTAGFIGTNQVYMGVKDSYWNMEKSGYTSGATNSSIGTTGLTTAQMTGFNAQTHMTGFDFGDTWQLTPTHPVLYWQDTDDFTSVPDADRLSLKLDLFLDSYGQSGGIIPIKFRIDVPARVRMEVFNTRGQRIVVLVDQHRQEGTYIESFNGNHFPAGVYLIRLQVNEDAVSRRFLLVR